MSEFPAETPDPEQLVQDWRGMADEFGREARLTSKSKIEALKFCADGLDLYLKSQRGAIVPYLPRDVAAVIMAATHLKSNDMQSLEDLIDAAETMKLGQA